MLNEFKKIHNNYYSYSENPTKSHIKFNVHCPKHGLFLITPDSHKQGVGCKQCGIEKRNSKSIKSHEDNLKDFISVHGTFYNYPERTTTVRTKFKVECPIHGIFLTTPNAHKAGKGCPTCAIQNAQGGWRDSDWNTAAINSKYFDSFKVYVLKCTTQEESFIKVGKTFRKLSHRFSKSSLPYNYEILHIITFNSSKECSKFERDLIQNGKEFNYRPLIPFRGHNECFHITYLDYINKTLINNED